jgi:hypothetical protein
MYSSQFCFANNIKIIQTNRFIQTTMRYFIIVLLCLVTLTMGKSCAFTEDTRKKDRKLANQIKYKKHLAKEVFKRKWANSEQTRTKVAKHRRNKVRLNAVKK